MFYSPIFLCVLICLSGFNVVHSDLPGKDIRFAECKPESWAYVARESSWRYEPLETMTMEQTVEVKVGRVVSSSSRSKRTWINTCVHNLAGFRHFPLLPISNNHILFARVWGGGRGGGGKGGGGRGMDEHASLSTRVKFLSFVQVSTWRIWQRSMCTVPQTFPRSSELAGSA